MAQDVWWPLTSSGDEWVFMAPVGDLVLTDAVNREFRVLRVTFVHRDRLPRVRTRLGLSFTVSEIKRTIPDWNFFDSAPAFAVMKHTGDEPEKVRDRCLEVIREELAILTLSKLGNRRNRLGPVALAGENPRSQVAFLAVNAQDGTDRFGHTALPTFPRYHLALHRRWKIYQDRFFFTKLLRIRRGETKVSRGWCMELRRASLMIGESLGANDLLKSFVWNRVTLMLIQRTGDCAHNSPV